MQTRYSDLQERLFNSGAKVFKFQATINDSLSSINKRVLVKDVLQFLYDGFSKWECLSTKIDVLYALNFLKEKIPVEYQEVFNTQFQAINIILQEMLDEALQKDEEIYSQQFCIDTLSNGTKLYYPNNKLTKPIKHFKDVWNSISPVLLKCTESIYLLYNECPYNKYMEAIYGIPFLELGASAYDDEKMIAIYNYINAFQLADSQPIIIHELAHLYDKQNGLISGKPKWLEAMKKDRSDTSIESITEYGKLNASDDFAESVKYYLSSDPNKRAIVKEKAPNRFSVLKQLNF